MRRNDLLKLCIGLSEPAQVQLRASPHHADKRQLSPLRMPIGGMQFIRGDPHFFEPGLHDIQRRQSIERLCPLSIIARCIA